MSNQERGEQPRPAPSLEQAITARIAAREVAAQERREEQREA